MLASISAPRRATAPRGFGFPDVTSRNRAFSTFGTRRPRLVSARTFRVAAKSSRPSPRGAANGAKDESSGTLDAENGSWRVEAASVQRARGTLRRISEFFGEHAQAYDFPWRWTAGYRYPKLVHTLYNLAAFSPSTWAR